MNDSLLGEAAERLIELAQQRRIGLGDGTPEQEGVLRALESVLGAGIAPEPIVSQEALAPLAAQLGTTVREWLGAASVSEDQFRADRLSFLLNGGIETTWEPRAILTAARRQLTKFGILSHEHRISVAWTSERPSMVFPTRIPGATTIAMPKRRNVLAFAYAHHELGHVVELDGRPSHWPLAQRWTRDPRVAEGWGLLLERLSQVDDWLVMLGVDPAEAERIAGHCRWEDRYNRCLAACVCLAADLPEGERAKYIHQCDGRLLRDGHVTDECERATYWRALTAGYRWCDGVNRDLQAAHGQQWWRSPEAWAELRDLRLHPFEHRSFERFRRATHCPFAWDSRWVVSTAEPAEGLSGYVRTAREGLDRTHTQVRDADADGFVLQLPSAAGATVAALRNTTLAVLRELADGDPLGFLELEDPAWWMRYGDDYYFVVAFGSCFSPDHTRYTFGESDMFLVFQHRNAFVCRFPSGVPAGVRKSIKNRFAAEGREYDYEMGVVPKVPSEHPGQRS